MLSVLSANSIGPDQTPQKAASVLGLHCLPISLLKGARHKWVKSICTITNVCLSDMFGPAPAQAMFKYYIERSAHPLNPPDICITPRFIRSGLNRAKQSKEEKG